LAQENGFSPAYLLAPEAGKNRSKAVHPLAREECNKYDLTTVPYFLIGQSERLIQSRWFAISSSHLTCLQSLFQSFIGGVAKTSK
jgi:hypothetical protein